MMGAKVILIKLYVSDPAAIITNPAANKNSPLKSAFFEMLICSIVVNKNPLYTQNCNGSLFLKLFMKSQLHFPIRKVMKLEKNTQMCAFIVQKTV